MSETIARIANRTAPYLLGAWLALLAWVSIFGKHLALPFLLFGPFVVILVHEAGHAIAGSAVGWRIWAINVFPFEWQSVRPHFVIRMRRSGPDVGGHVIGTPRFQSANTRLRAMIFAAGGPLASLSFGVGMLIFAAGLQQLGDETWDYPAAVIIGEGKLALPTIESVNEDFAQPILAGLGFYSLSASTLSLWPMRSKTGQGNDGMHLLEHARQRLANNHPETATRYAALLWSEGLAPRFWNSWITEGLEHASLQSEPFAGTAKYFLVLKAIDENHLSLARDIFRILNAEFPDWHEANALEAFFAAYLDNDARAAEASLARLRQPSQSRAMQHFRQLAIAFLVARDNDRAGAALKLAQFRDELRMHADHPNMFWLSQLQRASAAADV